MAIHEIVLAATMIIQVKAGTPIGTASGFFYSRGDHLFLVTNQHVCRDDSKAVAPELLRLTLHTDASDLRRTGVFDVPLYRAEKPVWKTHAAFPGADVALIEIDGSALRKKFVVKAFSKESFLPPDLPLNPGEDIFVMGFPLGVHDTVFSLPIFRSAMIASVYGVPFQGSPCFLTDANLHPGTSGSPVITKPKSTWVDDKGNVRMVTGTVYYLLGIHSATLSVVSIGGTVSSNVPLGLGTAWYAQLIEEIAETAVH